MKLQFIGGAQTVTGSKTLVTLGRHKILVDCGLFQGLKSLRLKNWAPLPFQPKQLDCVLLTHAHLDHSGALPLLVKEGFRGKIFCSAPTKDLTQLILEDSAMIQSEDADFANRHGFSKHHPAKPLYSPSEVKEVIHRIERVSSGQWVNLPGQIRFRLTPSSHILGSTFVELEAEGIRIAFSGDLGRAQPLLYNPPSTLEQADYLVLESTYGDRTHPQKGPPAQHLAQIIHETFQLGGQLIIPSFAIGRAQELLFLLSQLKAEKKIPELPIYLDSPMGVSATQIFSNHPNWHRLSLDEIDVLTQMVTVVESQQHSIEIMRKASASIIIAGSGMLSGGRVLHHLAARLPHQRNTVLLTGYQAAGTRGRLLQDGISELKMHGKYVPVKARIEWMSGLSAHADQNEILAWLKSFKKPPLLTFINHGEPQASDALRVKIKDALGWQCEVPEPLEERELKTKTAQEHH